ncbi:hypothetical protein KEJ50_06700 [Candidatus Bathyarchaeota archaeon]|nr:hypothetical protein [Candidatus Bathyarchaeota archaeon]
MKFNKTCFQLTFITIIISLTIFSIACKASPNIEILKVEYPKQVAAGEAFNIKVFISYSYDSWTIAELGVFHENFTTVFDCIKYYLTGTAVKTFDLTVTAPLKPMNLNLKVVTRYWYQNFWITDRKCIAEFSIEVYSLNEGESYIEQKPLIVNIDGVEWYYWSNNFSDSCIIWLSGGHAYKDHVTINPYEMETFSAMMYINDLAKEYNVLALRKGVNRILVPFTTQEFYALSYYPNSEFLKNIRDWILKKGCNFTYLIGYSTGGVAVGYEVAIRDPENWVAPNGAIIISAPLKGIKGLLDSVSYANSIKANIQLIYGKVWSDDLWPQGKEFYDNAPEKTDMPWYFKEWNLIPDSSHEVWVKEENGAHYNGKAYNLTVKFIEKARSLWFNIKGGEALAKLEVKVVGEKGFCKASFFKEDFASQRYFYLEEGYEKYKENLTLNFKKINWKVNDSTINLVFDKIKKEAYLAFIIENFSKEEEDSYVIKLHSFKGWSLNQTDEAFNFYNIKDESKIFGPSSLNILVIKLPEEAINASFNQQKFEIKYLKQKISLNLSIEIEKTQFLIGEKISFKLKATNTGQQRVTYERSSVMFKIVNSKGEIVYLASEPSKNIYEFIDPKQTLIYVFTWSQIYNDGGQVPPGVYKLIGSIDGLKVEKEIQLNASLIPGFQSLSILLGLIFGAATILLLKRVKRVH